MAKFEVGSKVRVTLPRDDNKRVDAKLTKLFGPPKPSVEVFEVVEVDGGIYKVRMVEPRVGAGCMALGAARLSPA